MMLGMSMPALASDDNLERTQRLALDKARISLLQAIGNIEAASGGKVVMAVVEPELKPPALRKGPAVYEIMTVKDGSMRAYFVDVVSGKVISQVDDWFGLLHFLTISKSEAFAVAKLSLAQAIALAERNYGGQTFEARTKEEDDVLYYRINLRIKNKDKRVYVNATTGRVAQHRHEIFHPSSQGAKNSDD